MGNVKNQSWLRMPTTDYQSQKADERVARHIEHMPDSAVSHGTPVDPNYDQKMAEMVQRLAVQSQAAQQAEAMQDAQMPQPSKQPLGPDDAQAMIDEQLRQAKQAELARRYGPSGL